MRRLVATSSPTSALASKRRAPCRHRRPPREGQAAVVPMMNSILGQLHEQTDVSPARTYEAVTVGNATMLHLLFGIDPSPLAVMPFTPAFMEPMSVASREGGLVIHPT